MGYIQGIGLWNSNMSINIPLLLQGLIMIRHVASFGCKMWGVNYVELNKGLHCCLQLVHTRYLKMVLGAGRKVDKDVLRA